MKSYYKYTHTSRSEEGKVSSHKYRGRETRLPVVSLDARVSFGAHQLHRLSSVVLSLLSAKFLPSSICILLEGCWVDHAGIAGGLLVEVKAFHIVNSNDLLVLPLWTYVLAAYFRHTGVFRKFLLLIEAEIEILRLWVRLLLMKTKHSPDLGRMRRWDLLQTYLLYSYLLC